MLQSKNEAGSLAGEVTASLKLLTGTGVFVAAATGDLLLQGCLYTERCLSRCYCETSVQVVLLIDQPYLLVQIRYSPPLSILFEAPACLCQADVEFAAMHRR